MPVTKDQFDKGLQSSVAGGKMLSSLLAKKWGIRLFNFVGNLMKGKKVKGLHCEQRYIPSRNGGPDIRIRIFKPLNVTEKLPGFLYLHGGGYSMGNPETALGFIEPLIATRPCVIVAPEYRRSIDAPFPAGFDDCYDSLLWLKDNADSLGAQADRFIVGGHSAGGGMTAAVSLKARDTKEVQIAFQLPIYPMIDDRQETESASSFTNAPVWNSKTNALGWKLYLQDLVEKNQPIPAYAAPSRNQDYTDFPPTITFVGSLDPFRDETIAYVEALKAANIPVTFERFEGGFHGFEMLATKAELSKRANQFLFEAFAAYYDEYAFVSA